MQLFDDDFADRFDFDVLDATKLIPEELVPVRRVGRLVLDRAVDNFFAETEQVAFCTQNVVPGIDFTNDPLLQGRNFSYLDTQLKRLGEPELHAPAGQRAEVPVRHFQQDGHMATMNPTSAASTTSRTRGRTTSAVRARIRNAASRPTPAPEGGTKQRVRSETFADHYSQARQFYVSQTPIEQQHIIDAFVFELSKVERPDIRARMVANLMQRRRRPGDIGRRRARPRRRGRPVGARTYSDHRPAAVTGAQHPAERSRPSRGAEARSARHRRERCRCARRAVQGRRDARRDGRARRPEGRRRDAQRRTTRSRATEDRRRSVGAVRHRRRARGRPAGRGAGQQRRRQGLRLRRVRHAKFVGYVEGATELIGAAGVVPDDGFVRLDEADGVTQFFSVAADLRLWAREALVHQI